MYSPFQLAIKYIRYYLTASNGKGHGIHSPFVFDFITKVLNDKRDFYAYQLIERRRAVLVHDKRLLTIEDFGAGSVTGNAKQRTVGAIARSALKRKKFGQLLFRIVNYYQPAVMIELGTSLGLSAAYLAMGNTGARVISLEGAASIASIANENFAALSISSIEMVTGNFDETLVPVLQQLTAVDLAFVDGNHRKLPTLHYFKKILEKTARPSILIFDDIHWSREMEEAWQQIKQHPDVLLTIDLFFMGLVFFNDGFKTKQHFVIRF